MIKSYIALKEFHNICQPLLGKGSFLILCTCMHLAGLEQFVGRMQDFRLYEVALTNR